MGCSGCGKAPCSCAVIEGSGIAITGSGTPSDPWIIASTKPAPLTPTGGDDCASINAAIAALVANNPHGGTLELGPGIFKIACLITIPESVDLVGAGGGYAGGQTWIQCTTAAAGLLVTGGGGVTGRFWIDGMEISQQPFARSGGTGGAGRQFEAISALGSAPGYDVALLTQAQNDLWLSCSFFQSGRDTLVIDQGYSGSHFVRCEIQGGIRYNLRIDANAGGPLPEVTDLVFTQGITENPTFTTRPSRSLSATTHGTVDIDGEFTPDDVGQPIFKADIPAGATIISETGVAAVISVAATGSSTGTTAIGGGIQYFQTVAGNVNVGGVFIPDDVGKVINSPYITPGTTIISETGTSAVMSAPAGGTSVPLLLGEIVETAAVSLVKIIGANRIKFDHHEMFSQGVPLTGPLVDITGEAQNIAFDDVLIGSSSPTPQGIAVGPGCFVQFGGILNLQNFLYGIYINGACTIDQKAFINPLVVTNLYGATGAFVPETYINDYMANSIVMRRPVLTDISYVEQNATGTGAYHARYANGLLVWGAGADFTYDVGLNRKNVGVVGVVPAPNLAVALQALATGVGTTGQRPPAGAGTAGAVRGNTTLDGFEVTLDGTTWRTVMSGDKNLGDVASAGAARGNLKVGILGGADCVAITNQALTGQPTIDGVATTNGTVVLCTGQTTPSQNGPWVLPAAGTGAWARPADFATGLTYKSRLIQVAGGTLYGGTVWQVVNSALATVDTTAETWNLVGLKTLAFPGWATGISTAIAHLVGANNSWNVPVHVSHPSPARKVRVFFTTTTNTGHYSIGLWTADGTTMIATSGVLATPAAAGVIDVPFTAPIANLPIGDYLLVFSTDLATLQCTEATDFVLIGTNVTAGGAQPVAAAVPVATYSGNSPWMALW